jgi:hypothetical protein
VLRGHTASRDERAYYCESVTPHNYDANSLHGLVGGRWKYIRANRPELYDLDRDPAESNNLAPRETEIVAEMQAELAARYASAQRGDAGADTVALKAEDRRQLEALGHRRARGHGGKLGAEHRTQRVHRRRVQSHRDQGG